MRNSNNNNQYLISVVVPVYNAEMFLKETLDSILYCNNKLEIIIVNDGSNDKSLDVALEFAVNYDNVKVIDQINSGVSVARNNGLLNCCGDWVFFVDADDEIYGSELNKIISLIEFSDSTIDVVKFNANRIFPGSSDKKDSCIINFNKQLFESVNSYLETHRSIEHSLWLHCFRKEFLVENRIEFSSGRKYCEDIEFVFKALMCAKGILVTDLTVYKYFIREGSAMSRFYSVSNSLVHLDVLSDIAAFERENSCKSDNFMVYIKTYLVKSFLSCLAMAKYSYKEKRFCKSIFMKIHSEYDISMLNDKLLKLSYNYFGFSLVVLKFRMNYLKLIK